MKNNSIIRKKLLHSLEDIKLTSEYSRLLEIVVKDDDEMRVKLAGVPELLKLYEKVQLSFDDLHCESVEMHYVEGFRCGLLFGIEAKSY